MSRRTQLILFLFGSAAFGYIVSQLGMERLLRDLRETGWWFVPILLLYSLVYTCNAVSWWLTMTDGADRPPPLQTFLITISAFSLNYVTPVVSAGGEPYKVAAATPWLGRSQAAATVILYRMLFSLAHLLSWLAALILAVVLVDVPLPLMIAGGAAFAVVAAMVIFVFSRHRRGLLVPTLELFERLPGLRRLAAKLAPRRESIIELDRQITDFYHDHPRRFWAALGTECLGRCLMMGEFFLVCLAVGADVSYWQAFVIGGVTSLVQNALFVVPFELGTKEAGMMLTFSLFRLDPKLGVSAAIVSRLRDLTWIAFGIALLWLGGRRRREAAA